MSEETILTIPLVVKIVADTNDADYISQERKIETKEQENFIRKVANALKTFQPYYGDNDSFYHDNNFPIGECFREDLGEKSPYELYSEYLTEDEIQRFEEEFVPDWEFGIHTIESIELRPSIETEKLL